MRTNLLKSIEWLWESVHEESQRDQAGTKLEVKRDQAGTKQEMKRDQAGTKLEVKRDQVGIKQEMKRDQAGTKQGPSKDQAGTKVKFVKLVNFVMQIFLGYNSIILGHRKDIGRTLEGHRKDIGRTMEGHRKDLGRTYQGLDSVSILSRQSDLAMRVWKYAACLTLFLCLGVGNAWAVDPPSADFTITPTLVSGTLYEATSLDIKGSNKGLWVEVPTSSAEGYISLYGTAEQSRYYYIYGSNGTVKDNDRKIKMVNGYYPTGVWFSSSDIYTSGGKYYLVFYTTDDFKASKVKFVLCSKTKVTSSTFYPLYASSSKTAAQLVTAASFPTYVDFNILNVTNANGYSSTVESPHDFKSNISSGTTYYYIAPNANTQTIVLYGLSNVKSIRLYGNGNGGGRTFPVSVNKVSGSGSAMTVSNITTGNAKTINEWSTGDLTSLTGYDADTYYTYTISYTGNASHLWGIYVEAGATSCSAPSSVTIDSPLGSTGWAYIKGNTIQMRANVTGGSGTFSYQWQKKIDSEFQNIDGAPNSATYNIDNCTSDNSGTYRCIVSTGVSCSTTSDEFDVKVYRVQILLSAVTTDYDFTTIDRTEGYVQGYIYLQESTDYAFKILEGHVGLGNNAAKGLTSEDCTNWGMWASNSNHVGLKTTFTDNYLFTWKFATASYNNTVSVTYPTHNQAADKKIYFDNSTTNWSNIYYRIGHPTYNENSSQGGKNPVTKVAGTANFYQMDTWSFSGFYAWHFADNTSWSGDNSIYKTDGTGYVINNCTDWQKYVVTEDITLTPTTTSGSNPTFYAVTKTSGMKTYTVTESGSTNCTVTLQKCTDYGSGTYTSLTSGGTVMPTQYIKVTITPTSGYKYDAITITGATQVTAPTVGSPVGVYYVTDDCDISVSCVGITYTVTLEGDGGTVSPTSLDATYQSTLGTSSVISSTSLSNYSFAGFYTDHGGEGTDLIGSDGKWIKNRSGYTSNESNPKWIHVGDETLYAKWTRTVMIDDNGGSADGSVAVVYKGTAGTPSVPTYSGHTLDLGYYAESGCSTKVMNLDGTLVSNVTNWTNSSGKWIQTGTDKLYAHWKCNTPEISCTENVITITVPSGATVYYTTTTDGSTPSDPTSSSTAYNPLSKPTISADTKIKAIAIQSGCTDSEVASADCEYEADGDKYYLFTPTKNAEPAHTGTLSGQFRCATSTPANNSQTIDGHSMSHWCKFSTATSLSGGTYYHGKTFIAYDIKTNSTDFTLYFYNNASAAKDIYYALVQEGITSAPTPVKVGTATANSTGTATFTITASKNTRILFYTEDQSNMRCHQIVAEESGSALPKPGESGYKVGFKGTYSRFTDYSEGTNRQGILDDSVKVVCYSNYSMGTADALKIHTSGTDYISFRTGASACRVKVCVSSSKTYYLGTSKSATTNSQTDTHTFDLSANTRYYINPSGNDVTVDSIVFLPAAAVTYTVSIAANPAGYGTVSASSITSIASGTAIGTSTNTLTVTGKTPVTATPADASDEYTYAFDDWTLSDGSALPSTVTADLSVRANFTRSANSYTLTWSSNGGSDLSGDYTSGSVAYGSDITAPNDPTLSNYTFDGWKTNNDGTGTSAGSTMPAANTTYYAAWKQTVTLTTGAQGDGGNQTPYVYLNGTGVSSFTAHTASGYTLQGYYTAGSGGVKVLNADGTFAAANVTDYITSSKWSRTGAAPTLYAQWVATEDCRTLKYVWKVTGNFCDDQSTATSTVSMISDNDYFTLSGTGYKQESGKSLNLQNTQNNYFLLTAKTGYQIKSICFYGKVQDSSVDYTTDGSSWSALASTKTDGDKYYTFDDIDASAFGIKLTAATPEGIWIRNMVIEVCAAGGTTYKVTYDDNGKTGGSVPTDDTNYSYGDAVTVLGNTGDLVKTNYTFAGWTTNDDGTGSSYVADNTFSITANTTLYAKWTQAVTFDANIANHGSTGGSATAVWNATGLTGITHATPASGYKLTGYYTAATSGTKVLNSDGSFAGDDITDWIDDGKWVQNDDDEPLLYAQYESAGALTWNLIVNSDTANLSTSTKTSAFTEISTSNMTNAALTGLTYTKSSKSSLTGKISTPAYDAGKYVYVTFQIASGYKFTPSMIQVPVQPVGNGEHKAVELRLTDTNTHSLVSGSATKCDGTEKGKKTTVTLAGDGTYFTGTVTLKIYVYPHASASASSNNCYRLGTPITIEGEIEEACATMPSYTSMSYTTTTFAPGADASGSPITIVGGENIDTYQWKYNTVNDRTSGTICGSDEASLVPLTNAEAATDGTRYYWCEMENTSCGITIKSPAVAITVAAAKSDATVTWNDPASTPNYGGGGYTIKATVYQTDWDGNAEDLVITAPAGINIYNVTSGTTSSQKWVQVDFDVQTSFDRSTYASNIPFTVSAAATATYNAISDEKDVDYSACTGGSASEELMPVNADSVNSTVKGWRFAGTGKMWFGHGSSTPGTGSSNIKSLDNTMAEGNIDHYYNTGGSYFSFYTEKAITGVRLYVYTSNSNVKVSNVYIANSQFATGTPSSGAVTYEVVYNDDNEGLDKGDNVYSAWAEITFDSEVAAGKYGLIKLDNNVKIAGIGLISTSGGGATLNTYLQWSGSLADGATVAKYTTDAYFTYSASKITSNTNTLGAITYSSSNTSVATVDATGKVALVAAGSTTIKATLAASGCYKKAEISYTLNVTEVPCAITAGTLTLTSGTESKCSSDNVTLTLTGFESGASIQWKDGDTNINNGGNYTIATDGTTSTLTTNQEGTYSVMVTKDCSVRSNRITISNKSTEVGAKRIVKNWNIKNGRLTPDIELWTLQNGAHLSSVAWSPANATGLADSDFYESDGKVYLKGKEPSSNTSGADINYTLTLTVEDDCGSTTAMSASGQLIYLHHQQNTDKHVLAFVVNGTNKGGFTEGITAEQTTSVPLYNEIAENFDVLATNIRSTDDEQALKEYYSQFDILCVTDYPNTEDKGVNKKSYVDALGALVDIRPILTMEAWVSKLANWKAKGVSGTPKSPTTRQYTMLLQCKDHEIFSGTELTKVGEGDETMYRISMVCDTLEDYKTLDATYGAGTHEKEKNYQYGKKPALQGFTFDATMADDGLLPLGLIEDGSGNDLQVGIERQTEMEARLMVLGINSYAMERLTDDGQTVVVNALKYLMKKNSEDIADCSNTFVGGDDEEDESTRYDWNVDSHWSGNAVPDRTQKVRIVAPCVIKADEKFHVTGVVIAPIGKYNHGADDANGSLTIEAGGALIVDGKVEAAKAPDYYKPYATSYGDVVIGSDVTKGNGTLIFDNDEGTTQAIVEMYSKATNSSATWTWQYVAIPFNDNSSAYRNFYGSWLYRWNDASTGWEVVPNRGELYPWVGYCLTQESAKTYVMDGTLVETGEQTFTVPDGRDMVIGNSWTAPIQIKQLTDEDFGDLTKNIYLFNTGNDEAGTGATATSETRYAAGTYVVVPIHASPYTGDSLISSLQAFTVTNTSGSESTLTLDYARHVRPARWTDNVNAGPMHSPKRRTKAYVEDEQPVVMKLWISDNKNDDRLVLLKHSNFSEGYDDGWDGEKILIGGGIPELYSVTDNGKESVSAIPELDGTRVGFIGTKNNEYQIRFTYDGDETLYLNDLKLQKSTQINNMNTYLFQYTDGEVGNRFLISSTPFEAPQITTGDGNVQSDTHSTKVQKVIYNDKMYIIRGGHIYDATGKVVK